MQSLVFVYNQVPIFLYIINESKIMLSV